MYNLDVELATGGVIMKPVEEILSAEDILDALDSVTWYNTYLAMELVNWKNADYLGGIKDRMIMFPDKVSEIWEDGGIYEQMQLFWMICVLLFGDYGTSPRFGRLTDIEGFYSFIDRITRSYQTHDEDYLNQ